MPAMNCPDLVVGQESKTTESGARPGIEVVAIRTSATGHVLDFRFRCIDLDRAMPFFCFEKTSSLMLLARKVARV